MDGLVHAVLLFIHVASVLVALAAVLVIDYLHLYGLRHKKSRDTIIPYYSFLSSLIIGAWVIIVLSGGILVYLNPSFLGKPLFLLKMGLFFVLCVNGFLLHKIVEPELLEPGESSPDYVDRIRLQSSFFGSISLTTWLGIFILAMTKQYGYSVGQFLMVYGVVFFVVFTVSMILELRYT